MYFRNQSTAGLIFVFFLLLSGQAIGQCGSVVDLNTWSQEGLASAGNWTVNGAGTQVTQNINGRPTFFVSPQDFINVRMTGTFQTTGADDDFMGFVFGYRSPLSGAGPGPVFNLQTYLFDWNQVPHGCTNPGRFLIELDGNFDLNTGIGQFCNRNSGGPYQVIASNSAPGSGWLQNVVYNFELTYLTDRTVIVVNNDTFFDVAGCFPPGRFGFYNYSQAPVVYSNFAYEILPDFSIAANNICLDDSARFFYTSDTCNSFSTGPSAIASWDWDFGDGNTSSQVNPAHLYASQGTYTVKLVVTDQIGCSDSTTQTITVFPLPPSPTISNNGPICEGSPLNLTASPSGGATYSWTGPGAYTSTQQSPTVSATAVPGNSGPYTLIIDNGQCRSQPVTTTAVVNPTPATPVASSNSPVCQDSALFLVASPVSGATYNWIGPQGFNVAQRTPTINNPTPANSGDYIVTATVNGCPSEPDTISIVVNGTPLVSLVGDTAICLGDTSLLSASGASIYNWSNGSTNSSTVVSPTTTTVYSVVGTSVDGCSAPAEQIQVQVNPLPTVALGADLVVCDSTLLDAGPTPNSYLWSTGATTQTLSVTQSGIYSVVVMNGDSCTATDTISIVVNPTQAADLGPDQTVCPGTAATLATTANFVNYLWSNGSIQNTVSVSNTGTFYVDVVDVNGCPSSDTVGVGFFPLLQGDIGPDTLLCDGDSTVLDASGWGGATYVWQPGGSTGPNLTVSGLGTYRVDIDDGNGCLYADSISITVDVPPTISLQVSDTVRCAGDPLVFTSAPAGLATYAFVNGGSVVQSGAGNSWTTSTLPVGNSVSVIGTTTNGCPTDTSAQSIAVNILQRPSGVAMSDTVCTGFPTTFDIAISNPSLSVTWTGTGGLSASGSSVTHTYLGPGTYSYVVVLDNGFCDTTITGTTTVLMNPGVLNTNDTTVCIGDNALLQASGTGTLFWYDTPAGGNLLQLGDSLYVPGATTSDTFYIEQNLAGCTNARRPVYLTVAPLPVADFISDPDTSIRLNIPQSEVAFANLSSGATSYLWDFGDGAGSTFFSPVHQFTDTGFYNVTLVAMTPEGCSDTAELGPFEVLDYEGFNVPTGFSPNGDGDNDTWVIDDIYFYPNNKVWVYNRWGKEVFQIDGYQNDWDGTWKGTPLPEGTYYWVIDLGEGTEPAKGFVILFR